MADASKPVRPEPLPVAPAPLPGLTALVTLLVCVVVIAALYLAREVLIPITLAVLLSFLLAPVVNLLRRLHLGRVPSVLLAAILGIGLVLGIAGLIGVQIADLAQKVPEYTYTVERKVEAVQDFAVTHITTVINGLKKVTPATTSPPAKPTAASTPSNEKAGEPSTPPPAKPVPVEVQPAQLSAVALAESVLTPIVSPLATAGIVFVVTIFVLLQREDLRDRFIRLAGSGDMHRTTVAMDDAGHRLSRYFLAQLSVNATFGCIIGLGVGLIGVPSPVLWGIMGMILRFVPYIGSPIAAILPVALAAAVEPGWSMAIWTAVLFLVVELLTGQVIEPLLYGHSTGLSPVAVIVAAIFWTWIWGPIGLILSMPLTLCLVVLGQHVKRLEFLDILLGDRPALTPIESFYQRMVAGDADEALGQAETILKERTLTSYYDDVALPGLQLASGDILRGALTAEQIGRLSETVEGLVRELDDHADAQPSPEAERGPHLPHLPHLLPHRHDAEVEPPPGWDSTSIVLCVAGRGPLDEAASLILAQLLTKHGLQARVLPNVAVSRMQIGTLPLENVGMICIPHLDLEGAPVYLRNLLRRLRQRLTDQPILVGLWSPGDPLLASQAMRDTVGADFCVTSLQEAVAACLHAREHGKAPVRPQGAALTAA